MNPTTGKFDGTCTVKNEFQTSSQHHGVWSDQEIWRRYANKFPHGLRVITEAYIKYIDEVGDVLSQEDDCGKTICLATGWITAS